MGSDRASAAVTARRPKAAVTVAEAAAAASVAAVAKAAAAAAEASRGVCHNRSSTRPVLKHGPRSPTCARV